MGTTRIKVIDLSGEQKEIKTSRKHAEKLTGFAKIKEEKKPKKGTVTPSDLSANSASVATLAKGTASASPEALSEVEGAKGAASATVEPSKPSKSTTSPRKHLRHQGSRYQNALKLISKDKYYPPKEAIELLYKINFARFDPTVEAHLNVTDKNVRASINFPHPPKIKTPNTKKLLIFGDQQSKINDQRIIWGDEKTISDIQSGKLKPKRDFDKVFAQPKFMLQLAKIAKILGPQGLMPNPKNGTIITDPQDAVKPQKETGIPVSSEPTVPIVHTVIGKLSKKPIELEENLEVLIKSIGIARIKKAFIKSTMSPSIKVDLTAFA